MRIGFIERMASEAMQRKGLTRRAALGRQSAVWSGLGLICAGIWAFAPTDGVIVTRRSSEAPLEFVLLACAAIFFALGAACFLSRASRD